MTREEALLAIYLIGFVIACISIANDANPKGPGTVGYVAAFILSTIWPALIVLHVSFALMRLGLGIKYR